jgi:hypothetical protein
MICAASPRVGPTNFTTVEEILLGEEVLAGTFFLFEHPIIILFDLGASHDFMSLAYAQKAKLTLWATMVPYSITTLSYPVPRKRERSLHTCAQDVQITHMATI